MSASAETLIILLALVIRLKWVAKHGEDIDLTDEEIVDTIHQYMQDNPTSFMDTPIIDLIQAALDKKVN
jgi:hypothetical protein